MLLSERVGRSLETTIKGCRNSGRGSAAVRILPSFEFDFSVLIQKESGGQGVWVRVFAVLPVIDGSQHLSVILSSVRTYSVPGPAQEGALELWCF